MAIGYRRKPRNELSCSFGTLLGSHTDDPADWDSESGHDTIKITKLNGLEKHLQAMGVRYLSPETKELDVERTNRERLGYAAAHHLTPVVYIGTRRGTPRFRRVRMDKEGLVCVTYEIVARKILEPLSDEESVSMRFAAEYLGVRSRALQDLVQEEGIRTEGNRVNFSDLNQIKAARHSRE